MSTLDEFKETSALYGANAPYIEAIYEAYLTDPNSISEEWQRYFKQYREGKTLDIPHGPIKEAFEHMARHPSRGGGQAHYDHAASSKQTAVLKLIEAYRSSGHKAADINPINLRERPEVPQLNPSYHGLTQADLETEFSTGGFAGVPHLPLKKILEILERTYSEHIGTEFMHINDHEERSWIQSRLENMGETIQFSREEKLETLKQLVAANGLESYLHMRYVGQKRFSLEGGDALIPLMHELVNLASDRDAEEIVIGMAHRGRLNMLVNILSKAPQELFDEFEGKPTFMKGSGDVKYHMGYSSTVKTRNKPIHLALAFNPSHLEYVNPVVEGSVRARLERRITADNKLPYHTVLPVLIHGDAAFAGQGIVMETLQLSGVRGYSCGGTVHIVINNQIGFTTSNPLDVRSSAYSTDVAKIIQAPIFHVNGDDPEAVRFVTQIALEYRQTFNKDVVIDIISYRRLGHNEADEPSATQPMMYKIIKNHKIPADLYAAQLIAENVLTQEDYKAFTQDYRKRLEEGKPVGFPVTDSLNDDYSEEWKRILAHQHEFGTDDAKMPDTAVSLPVIKELTEAMNRLPESFVLNPRVKRIHDARLKMGVGGQDLDWGYAEIMAYATLLNEGYPVRISGQDAGRGTFFHRHAVYHNQQDGSSYAPLANLNNEQARFDIYDSILSEAAVLGFEYGYSTAEPKGLVIWEAQFGDFSNGAQVHFDQFISSGETKWQRLSGLVMLLPHGYEGQGPEHSSARPERYLQMCAEKNMTFVVPTTPAQAFHMLRRQTIQSYCKPLVCMSPKSLLRHRQAVSSLEDLSEGGFQPIIPEIEEITPRQVEKIVMSVGKIYYDLVNERAEKELNTYAIVRLEEIYPFPKKELKEVLATYPKAKELIFCQDEPYNQGFIAFVRDYLDEVVGESLSIRYVSRPKAAAPAVGYSSIHAEEQDILINEVFA